METCLGASFAMQQRIIAKLLETGATSIEKAASAIEANFDMQEKNWLCYVAGGFASIVKETRDKRYYVVNHNRK
jgi:hypothetical protein